MKEQKHTILQSVPAAEKLHKVPNFNPLQYLTRTTSKRTGEKVLKLDLAYKRLWFRLAYPNGKMLFRPLRITDQMAIFEAQLYFDGNDPTPAANFTSTKLAREVGGQYIQAAQDEALNEALDNAGFGIQLCDLVELRRETEYGSEIPLSQVEPAAAAAVSGPTAAEKPERAEAAPEPKREERRPEPVKTAPQVKAETPEAAENPQNGEKPTAGETAQPPVQAAPAATQDVVQPPDAAQPEAADAVGSMLQMLGGTNPPKAEEAAAAPGPSAGGAGQQAAAGGGGRSSRHDLYRRDDGRRDLRADDRRRSAECGGSVRHLQRMDAGPGFGQAPVEPALLCVWFR